ncbi:MAG: hypothetical protein WBF17_00740 [Phycisphaerae bacterium]
MIGNQKRRAGTKHNGGSTNHSCALCGCRLDRAGGLDLSPAGTCEFVCDRCVATTDPAKLRWREWAKRAAGESGGPPRAAAAMGLTIDFRGASPVEAPVRCPICQGEQVQLTSVLCILPNRQVAYMDHRGLQLYETDIPGGFAPGTLMVFRCSENHLLYRNLCPAGGKTLESSLGAHAGPAVLDQFLPMWASSSQDDSVEQHETGVGE